MKVLRVIFTLLFISLMLIFLRLQWNHPERLIWVAIYITASFTALLSLSLQCKPCLLAWCGLLSLICLIMLIQIAPLMINEISKLPDLSHLFNNSVNIKSLRQFTSLILILLYCLYTVVLANKYKHYPTATK